MEFLDVLTGMEAGELWQQLREHTNDPVTKRCPRCHTQGCAAYRRAQARLKEWNLLDDEEAPCCPSQL